MIPIEQILPLYMGCTVTGRDSRNPERKGITGTLTGLKYYTLTSKIMGCDVKEGDEWCIYSPEELTLHLRAISSLSVEECTELWALGYPNSTTKVSIAGKVRKIWQQAASELWKPAQISYLFKLHIDLYNLISDGRAVGI